ncbi:Enamine deaminase RidA, house cleaning of reactive enamine intermediates, YjgF/YER057c/UK114 family [Paracoccus halophilus]|uniref:Enamine deaminase RidA, house cleaning of reactive enamine intermediates, YjgF/YER057c/UK114 family n=1 Tax=Paracoccus halophilus TaxID=376733 RepID=A0A099EV29_9RHOB|nr:RidA family protein [Paracoccus halophilus]KGJ01768.1 endoribonuclease L-PSP [Paracoccus halophilus]SFA52666.1 Enamine deaminase RidA, house cleaning of reactive enamine intermediates, YjgF/YER057c/UK114 family [Paracoccus halophilus]
MKREIQSEKLAVPNGHFSQATIIEAKGRLLFISGMTARTADGAVAAIGDAEGQTRQVCENIKAAVEAAGGKLEDIVRVDCYCKDIQRDFQAIHRARRDYFHAPVPASTMVEVPMMVNPDYLIEINAIAVLPAE